MDCSQLVRTAHVNFRFANTRKGVAVLEQEREGSVCKSVNMLAILSSLNVQCFMKDGVCSYADFV